MEKAKERILNVKKETISKFITASCFLYVLFALWFSYSFFPVILAIIFQGVMLSTGTGNKLNFFKFVAVRLTYVFLMFVSFVSFILAFLLTSLSYINNSSPGFIGLILEMPFQYPLLCAISVNIWPIVILKFCIKYFSHQGSLNTPQEGGSHQMNTEQLPKGV
tara:strand:- start:585 stop:1073 length:489 start_codon:yes stop_codon:yes gene_type:complete